MALRRYGMGDYEPLLAELQAKPRTSFERVGVDRALAIAADLALLGMHDGATILDVGCRTGTISRLLAETGYCVTGVDSDVVVGTQKWQESERLMKTRQRMETATCRFIVSDIVEYLEQTSSAFDVTLLLSVLHHFLAGYGYSGVKAITAERFDALLRTVCSRTKSYLYVEAPGSDESEEMPPDASTRFLLPSYFLEAGLSSRVQRIGSAVATNGKPRRLYRVHLR